MTQRTTIGLFAGTLLVLLGSVSLHAQWRVGPAAGYEFGLLSGIDRSPGVINTRPDIDGSGKSYNHTVWMGAGFERVNYFGPGWNGVARIALGVGSGRFTSDTFDDFPELDLFDEIVYPRRSLELSSTTAALRLDAGALYPFGGGLSAGGGLWLDARFLAQHVLVQRTEQPTGGGDSVLSLDGTAGANRFFSTSPLSFGPWLALALDIPIASGSILRTDLFGRMNIPTVVDAQPGKFSGGLGLTLLFDLAGSGSLSQLEPPTVAPPRIESTQKNGAGIAIDLYAGEESRRSTSVEVGLRSTLHRRYLPLLPLLSYSADSVAIPSRYAKLGAAEADRFSLNALVGMSPAQLHGQMLNILGMRMRAEPAAAITIVALASGRADERASAERAERVRQYLVDIWKIAPTRIGSTIQRAGNGRSAIRITSSMPALFSPVVLQWIAGEISVPPIGLDPSFDPKETRSWRIVVSQGDRTLGEYSSEAQSNLAEIELPLLLRGRRGDSTLLPLVATLTVENTSGEKLTARDELKLLWSKDSMASAPASKNAEIFSYLLLDPPDSMPELDLTNRAMMLKIQESARTGARLTLSGFGQEKPIAEQAAGEILAALERRKVQAVELHVITDTDRATPLPEEVEGRSGVDVVIEQ